MLKRTAGACVLAAGLLVFLSVLMGCFGPLEDQQPAAGRFVNEFSSTLPESVRKEVNRGIQAKVAEVAPHLQGWDITAFTEVSTTAGEYTITSKVLALSSTTKTAQYFEVQGVIGSDCSWRSLTIGEPTVPQDDVVFLEPLLSSADVERVLRTKSAVGPEPLALEPKAVNTAHALVVNVLSDRVSQDAATTIAGYFRGKGYSTDRFHAPHENTVWPYLTDGVKLLAWYSNSHAITSRRDGAPCDGLVMGSGSQMTASEFRGMRKWIGLAACVVYLDGCNTYMNPLHAAVWEGHSVRTYIGAVKLSPIGPSEATDVRFWNKVLNQGKTMATALAEAMRESGTVGLYSLRGASGRF